MAKSKLTPLERLMKHVEMIPFCECWIWTGCLNVKGYGKIGFKGETLAHRYSYKLFKGPIPEGTEIDHTCSVRCCVRPGHLEAVTHTENIRRGKGPTLRSERAKLVTHCKRGHEFTSDNTYHFVNASGNPGRSCRECSVRRANESNERKRLAKEKEPKRPRPQKPFKQFCKYGHELTEDNVYHFMNSSRGKAFRACKQCCHRRNRQYKANRKKLSPAVVQI